MEIRKPRPNPKRKIWTGVSSAARAGLVAEVTYAGNPVHKRNPGDFGLTPPAQPRPDKTLCDEVELFGRADALRLLRRGICRGLVSVRLVGRFPQNIWSMTDSGTPVEAQLENRETGAYHGYPLMEEDPFAEVVRQAWDAAHPCGARCGADGCNGEPA
jgi:hypothetical protein